MCRARPGLRCTPHSLKTLEGAQSELDSVMSEYNAIKNGRNQEKKDQLLQRINAAQEKVAHAERDYYASRGGIEDLQKKLADPSLSETERGLYQSRLELAEYDRATQQAAYNVYQRMKANITPEEFARRDALITEEKNRARELASAMNHRVGVERARSRMAYVESMRKQYDEILRRKTIGAKSVSYAKLSTTGNIPESSFVPLSPSDFGRASEYVPFGAYGRITGVPQNDANNHHILVEDSIVQVGGDRLILVAS